MFKDILWKIDWRALMKVLLSVIFALIVGAIFMVFSGYNPLEVYGLMFEGGFVGMYSIMDTLRRATPLILTGLAVLAAFKTGTFNIGVEGQLYMGAIVGAGIGYAVSGLPPV